MKYSLFILFFFIAACQSSVNQPSSSSDPAVESLLEKMTLEEKIGQMNQYNGFWDATGPVPSSGDAKNKYEHLKKGWVGSVLNVTGVERSQALQKLVVEETRLGIPLIFGFDVIHGFKTTSPIPLAESCSWDLKAMEQSARVAAIEATAAGLNWTFAPMVDLYRDARWGRVMEGSGEDPYLGSKIAIARIKGFQGEDLSAPNTMAATAKHYAGYGFAESGRDYNLVDVSISTLYNTILPPFKAAVENGVQTFMNAFNSLNGTPATGSQFLQRKILKGDWNFKGFMVSDWGSIGEMTAHGYTRDLKHATEVAANAGSDMDMESYAYVKHLKTLVEENKIKMSVIDDAVRRILTVKSKLGLLKDPYKYFNKEREESLINHPDHHAAALDMAKKSIVLLKNTDNLLPLAKNQKKIAVIGALASDKNSPLGSWRLGSDDNTAVSVLEGLDKYTSDYRYIKGADLITAPANFIQEVKVNEKDRSGFQAAIDLARTSDVVIMVLGEHGFQSGEGRSRTELGLPGVQQDLLEVVYKVNQNIVLVLMNGRPLVLTWAHKYIPAILETWQLGSQAGHAIAQVLFGDYNPSGKLTMSFPRRVGQIPIYYNRLNTGRPSIPPGAPGDLVFWSHYSDVSNEPLYPFGYGLSYTTFEYTNLIIDTSNTKSIKVSVKVKNTGKRAGEEVVQLYVRDVVASLTRPTKELKGFEKITLEAGETKTVEFNLTDQELGFYDNEGKFKVESGKFEVMVGTSSQKGLKGEFER